MYVSHCEFSQQFFEFVIINTICTAELGVRWSRVSVTWWLLSLLKLKLNQFPMQQNWEVGPKASSSGCVVSFLRNQFCWLAEFKVFSLVLLLLPPTWDDSQTALIRHDLLNLGLPSFEIYKKVTSALDSIIAAQHRPRQSPLCLDKTEIKMGPGCFPDQRVLIASTCSWDRVHSLTKPLIFFSSYWLVSVLFLLFFFFF